MAALTPMMQQYQDIKEKNNDCILFYRLGDFYEMFFDDAVLASKELELTLTGRDCGQEERAPMCGVPYHSCEGYIARLVAKGYKVAICEQMENPAEAKGIVKRDIVRIITPGTVTESNMLDDTKNNYCVAIWAKKGAAALAFADISTGEIYVTSVIKGEVSKILNELGRFSPREAVIGYDEKEFSAVTAFLKERLFCLVTPYNDYFDEDRAKEVLAAQYGEDYLSECDLYTQTGALQAAGALIGYLQKTQCGVLRNVGRPGLFLQNQYLELDINTRRNLEITETMRAGEKKGSLLGVMDYTKSAMGARTLRRWLEQPLCSVPAIQRRQNAVGELVKNPMLRDDLSTAMKKVYDLERLMTKIVYNTAGGRDLKALQSTLEIVPDVRALLCEGESVYLRELADQADELLDIVELIDKAIDEDPPFSIREGGVIRAGYHTEIDDLRAVQKDGKSYIAAVEQNEREKTGIKNLKISYNKVFGYYLEVTKSYFDLVPDHYIRKQTLANCERYITEELKEYERKVLTAEEKSVALEYEAFCAVRDTVAASLNRVQQTASALAAVDVLCSLATLAAKRSYCPPDVDMGDRIVIKEGRHPVVEEMLDHGVFVANDTLLDTGENSFCIITGPNMAGKSTFMRQVAIITLMAQIGSFVPAKSAQIGICDKIFTRVGASDDLAAGQSTFMVEMSEVSYILKHATRRSLLIFDEIGRGTSTFDGMSIARAVVEHVADKKKLGAKTLFATHYHELTVLESEISSVKNYNIAVKKRGEDITFLRKIVRGGADDSYGIEVAKLAGVPDPVIARAKEILANLEQNGLVAPLGCKTEEESDGQMSLACLAANELVEELKRMDVNTLTPIECMQKLHALTEKAKEL